MAALTWVQTHIGAFGGDSQRVTLAADRGGADVASIHLLISRPTRPQLFRKALLMVSGMACLQYYSTVSLIWRLADCSCWWSSLIPHAIIVPDLVITPSMYGAGGQKAS